MEINQGPESNKNKDTGKNILILVLVILVILSGIKLYRDSKEKEQQSEEILILSEDNSDLNMRLDSMTFQLDLRIQEMEKLGGDIDSLVTIKDQLIQERNSDRKRSAAEIANLNRKIDGYGTLLKEKDSEIIKLREVNEQLYSENKDLKTTKAEIEEEVVKLNMKQQELEDKVNVAATLKAENIVIAAVNSRGRERTDEFRNRQLERLKVSFSLADNKVAQTGTKDIYVQVITPNNQVIFDVAKGSGTFNIDGREEFYTAKQDILFDNTGQQLTYFYEKGSDYTPGLYNVRIYADGVVIGNKSFEVR
jgi:Tfp pilus assembly protein PilN